LAKANNQVPREVLCGFKKERYSCDLYPSYTRHV